MRTEVFQFEPGARYVLLHAQTPIGDTPLSVATRHGQADMLYELYLAGIRDVDTRNHFGATALHTAALHGHPNAAQALLQLGADVDARKADGETALHVAADGGDAATAGLLLRAGAAVDVRAVRGQTPLHRAVARGCAPVAALLLDAGASVWIEDHLEQCPAAMAVVAVVVQNLGAETGGVLNLFAERGLLWRLELKGPDLDGSVSGSSVGSSESSSLSEAS